jgi:RHS repeat-associated protein
MAGAELFDPNTQTFQSLNIGSLTARAGHTATLLTDGRVLIAGGVSADDNVLAQSELWDVGSGIAQVVSETFATARQGGRGTLLPDGTVLIWGGLGESGIPLTTGEVFDPVTQRFSSVNDIPFGAESTPLGPELEASMPVSGASDVPTDSMIALRFSKPLRVDTLNTTTVTLSGPRGPEGVRVIPAEDGRLTFLTPQSSLVPGATYTVALNGVTDRDGALLPFTLIPFTTVRARDDGVTAQARGAAPGAEVSPGGAQDKTADERGATSLDDWEWKGAWRDGKPYSPWQGLPPLRAPFGTTAVSGQVLQLNGNPLENVTLRIGSRTSRTDRTGRFLLTAITPRPVQMIIDGRTASRERRTYGVFEVGLTARAGETTVLAYTIWMPTIDTNHAVEIPAYTTHETVVSTPRIRDLELRIPAHSTIRDHEARIATRVSITPIPTDRPPFPLPANVNPPVYFTIQPGAGYVYNRDHLGARLIYPNYRRDPQPSGARFDFWHYAPADKGWHIYGQGTVTPGARQVVPDTGVAIYEFTGAMINVSGFSPPGTFPQPGNNARGGDPVDLGTGLFVLRKTDLVIQDVLPIVVTRTYRQGDNVSRAFGLGTTHPYDLYLWSARQWQEADLILPDGGRIHYIRISPGTGFTDAEFEHRESATTTATPTAFYASRIKWNGNGWNLTLKDGTMYVFGNEAPLNAIRDRYGNQLTISRAGTNVFGSPIGNITRITSPNGRWIEFTYDPRNRIVSAKDNIGRVVAYAYDATDLTGRLVSVTNPKQELTRYTYDGTNRDRLLTITDAKGITFLTNVYDSNGRTVKQTQADGSTYTFAYTLTGGKVTQTDVTDPRGIVRRVTFNAAGYALTDTRAIGRPEQQTLTYERAAGSNLVLSLVDQLGRRTRYTYDPVGNVVAVVRLFGTPEAVTTTFAYEPAFNQVTRIVDPLGRATTFGYDTKGSPTTVTDPLGNVTTLIYNPAGQPVSLTNPLGHTTHLTFQFGDLVAVTDPLGNSATRFLDGAGRTVMLTNPLGNTTRYDHDPLNAVKQVFDALGGRTAFSHDANGNVLTVTDARSNVTAYAYNRMDRLESRTDPLLRRETYLYDPAGNLTQFTNRKGQATSFAYDALGRLNRATYSDASTTTYVYDAGNRLKQLVDSRSGTITVAYDSLDRVTQEATPQGTVTYAYDKAGRRTSMTVVGQPTVTYIYDNADRLTRTTQATSVVTMAYDRAGRRTTLTLPGGIIVVYVYDAASRLTGITYKRGSTVLGNLTYQYDRAGNRVKTGGTWARASAPSTISSASYDKANQQLASGSRTMTFDRNGNVQSVTEPTGTTTFTWDARNRLAAVAGPSLNASFTYDALGRRIAKTFAGTTTSILHDGLNPVQERSGGAVIANILSGLRIDEYFARTDGGGSRTVLAAALGSTVALTDNSGMVQTEYTYEPFGRTSVLGPNTNPFQFASRENDKTGLYYLRARYYEPTLHRFLAEDPIGFLGGDANLYSYVGNSPLNRVDPYGLFGIIATEAAAAGLRDQASSSHVVREPVHRPHSPLAGRIRFSVDVLPTMILFLPNLGVNAGADILTHGEGTRACGGIVPLFDPRNLGQRKPKTLTYPLSRQDWACAVHDWTLAANNSQFYNLFDPVVAQAHATLAQNSPHLGMKILFTVLGAPHYLYAAFE